MSKEMKALKNIPIDSIEILLLIILSFSPLLNFYLGIGLTVAIIIYNYKYLIKYKKYNLWFLIALILQISIVIVMDVGQGTKAVAMSFYFIMRIVCGFVASQKYELEDLLRKFEKVVFVLALFSLIGVVVYTFFPGLIYKLPTYSYYEKTNRTAIIFNIQTESYGVILRNAGMAWEPGAFQFLLNLALYSYIRTEKRINVFRIIIYIIAIATTKSTIGIFIGTIVLLKLVVKDKRYIVFIGFLGLIFSGAIVKELNFQLNYKLLGSYAFETRLTPLINALRMGIERPFGIGNAEFDAKYKLLGLGAWDSIGQIAVRYGITTLTFFFIYFIDLLKKAPIVFIIFILTLVSQNIWASPLVAMFYFTNFSKNRV